MSQFIQILGDWGHALAAALFAAVAIVALRRSAGGPERFGLAAALFFTALWALYTAFNGVDRSLSGLAESMRNGAWLTWMYLMLRRGEGQRDTIPVSITTLYATLAALLLLQSGVDLMPAKALSDAGVKARFIDVVVILRMMVAVGSLILVHNLFTVAAPEGRSRVGLILAALAAMWTYDLNLYVIGYLSGSARELYALRGLAMAALSAVIALDVQREGTLRLRLSRTVAFRSASVMVVGLYLAAMALSMSMIEAVFGEQARVIEMSLVFAMAVLAIMLMPSARFRSLLKVLIAKHFFQHRYDYRAEWTRFIDTIGHPGSSGAPLEERVIQAMADITDSPAGMLLLPGPDGYLVCERQWNWNVPVPERPFEAAQAAAMMDKGWIIDLDAVRARETAAQVPAWMLSEMRGWALVPLIHFDRLVGAVLLARPRVDRRLDWEDFDMLRAAGRQIASYIREAQGQQALEDARRFDEFNRRFAFIMHDIKNLVSQLSLLARNAERHAENPEFRADMIITLRESVGRMNDMIARLSQQNRPKREEAQSFDLALVASNVARSRERIHPVEVVGQAPAVFADPARVEQIVMHLVQNAIDASEPGAPVMLRLGGQQGFATVEVIDTGCGMSAEFIRRELFKPFSSSKAGGFGLGAFEARELARSIGGRIEVDSRPGEGSCFTLFLPLADSNNSKNITERAA